VVPGAKTVLNAQLDSEVEKSLTTLFPAALTKATRLRIPKEGIPHEELLATMAAWRKYDADPNGRVFAYMYGVDDKKQSDFMLKAFNMHAHENALNPIAFPALRQYEVEVVRPRRRV
jgi:glutamate/tyrosine decarboxylase-like PLP-dependent enzyme